MNINELKASLLEGKSKKQIAKDLSIPIYKLNKIISDNSLQSYYSFSISKNNQKSNKSVDIDFFKCIDDEFKAYIFGFILSDGWISKKTLGFTVQHIDCDILLKIKSSMRSNHKVSYRKFTDKNPQNSLIISSKEIVDDLIKLGITTNKSFEASIPFDKIPSHLIRHTIRGIFDGDGSFSQNNPCIATSSSALKDDLVKWSESVFNYTPSIAVSGNHFKIYFRKPAFNVICNIYQDSQIYLDRKYLSFLSYYEHRIKNQ